jgi:hypothetical protein
MCSFNGKTQFFPLSALVAAFCLSCFNFNSNRCTYILYLLSHCWRLGYTRDRPAPVYRTQCETWIRHTEVPVWHLNTTYRGTSMKPEYNRTVFIAVIVWDLNRTYGALRSNLKIAYWGPNMKSKDYIWRSQYETWMIHIEVPVWNLNTIYGGNSIRLECYYGGPPEQMKFPVCNVNTT